jgi:hypothetical protein
MASEVDFPLECDHIVIFAGVDAPEAKTLEALGLQGFGGITVHGGMGTASTAFFFQNSYLELLWVQDEALAGQKFGAAGFDLSAHARWRETGASPFSLALRRRPGAAGPLPFPTQRVTAEWMPPGTAIEVLEDNPSEPSCLVIPDILTFPSFRANIPDLPHPLGMQKLTGIKITVQGDKLTPQAQLLSQSDVVTLETGSSSLMELTFDDGLQGKSVDVRPTLPLVLNC